VRHNEVSEFRILVIKLCEEQFKFKVNFVSRFIVFDILLEPYIVNGIVDQLKIKRRTGLRKGGYDVVST
jgi:hypothetical protein